MLCATRSSLSESTNRHSRAPSLNCQALEHPTFDCGPRPTLQLAHRRADDLRRRAGLEVCRDGGALARTVFATAPSPTQIDLSAAAAVDESTRHRAAADQGETGEGPDPTSMDLMARVANLCDTVAQRLVLADHGHQGQGPRPQVPVPLYTGYDDRKSVADFLAELTAYKLATGASDDDMSPSNCESPDMLHALFIQCIESYVAQSGSDTDWALIARATAAMILRSRRRRHCREWIRFLLRSRETFGELHHLVRDMRLDNGSDFFQYFRMTRQRCVCVPP
ncbi:uncharacterized protein ISCGN_032084 [Ixodes scapularis]